MNDPAHRWSPCPCCGYLVHDEGPGSYLICPICFWEDDLVQLRWPRYAGGANKASLVEAQRTYARLGACEERLLDAVRAPGPGDARDKGFRPIGDLDDFEATSLQEAPWPADPAVLYWWRNTFWRQG
jgi:hypothetical protein